MTAPESGQGGSGNRESSQGRLGSRLGCAVHCAPGFGGLFRLNFRTLGPTPPAAPCRHRLCACGRRVVSRTWLPMRWAPATRGSTQRHHDSGLHHLLRKSRIRHPPPASQGTRERQSPPSGLSKKRLGTKAKKKKIKSSLIPITCRNPSGSPARSAGHSAERGSPAWSSISLISEGR